MSLGAAEKAGVPLERAVAGVEGRGRPPHLPLAFLALPEQRLGPVPGPQTPGPRGPQALSAAPRLPALRAL